MDSKHKAIKELGKYGRVLITSESPLPQEFEGYRITVSPEKIHDLLYYAMLYIGEGATMATESAILGTPSIYVSSFSGTLGNLIELEQKYGLMYNYNDPEKALKKAVELLQKPHIKKEWNEKRETMLKDVKNVTGFMVWFIEDFPKSLEKINDDGILG
jgi:predicted glycosyltransferase